MTRIHNDPADFAEESLAGFCELHSAYVRAVPGGVVRRTPGEAGKVAVIFGGGSGHYPAFAGLVGPGFGDGAVVGNVFTSPSAQYAYSVARRAELGGGVIFSYGNYAGDVMNFGIASEQLASEGIDARNVVVSDDVLSAPFGERHKRRGIAGDFTVFKILAAAAEEGASIDEVERLGTLANDRTRTVGIALAGCTIPGQNEPLFNVDPSSMAIGLGIHGEPGLGARPLGTAKEIAEVLVEAVLAEDLDSGFVGAANEPVRAAVILNGLGATKYEELFLLWAEVAPLLRDRGISIIAPEVGELVTSLDMAGLSLTVMWLDNELEPLWLAAVDTPAYRTPLRSGAGANVADDDDDRQHHVAIEQGSAESREAAQLVLAAFNTAHDVIVAEESHLARLDSVAGDGDHGRGMVRGITAAKAAAVDVYSAGGGAATVLARAGDAWAAEAGGTSGVLWGSALRAASVTLGDHGPVTSTMVLSAVHAFVGTLTRLGKAQLGDKTMVDAVAPFSDAVAAGLAQGLPVDEAWRLAADAAEEAARATSELTPKLGRARPHAERSIGTPDPGAVSFALIVDAIAHLATAEASTR